MDRRLDAIRDPMATPIPPTLPSIVSTSPVWTPARTSRPISLTDPTISVAHRTAAAGPSSVAKKPSPAVSTSVPPCAVRHARTAP